MHVDKLNHPNVSIGTLGPKEANQYGLNGGWSLKLMQTQEDVFKQYGLAVGLRRTLRDMNVRKAYAPNVEPMSAIVVGTHVLNTRIRLGGHTYLYRKKQVPADGVFLRPGEAFVMSAAGCPVIIATAGEYMIVAHAGRDSLIERSAVLGAPTREHPSIVDAIIGAFGKNGFGVDQISMCMHLAIPAIVFEHRFDHPFYGAYNRALARFVDDRWPGCTAYKNGSMFLDLESVFVEQARRAGLRYVWAALSLDTFPDLVHTRAGENPHQRNLVVVRNDTAPSSDMMSDPQGASQTACV